MNNRYTKAGLERIVKILFEYVNVQQGCINLLEEHKRLLKEMNEVLREDNERLRQKIKKNDVMI